MASIPVVLPELRRRGRLTAVGKAASVAGCAVAAACVAPAPVLLPTDMPARFHYSEITPAVLAEKAKMTECLTPRRLSLQNEVSHLCLQGPTLAGKSGPSIQSRRIILSLQQHSMFAWQSGQNRKAQNTTIKQVTVVTAQVP